MTDGKVKTGAKHILLRKGAFYPTFIFMLCAVITGIFKNEWLQAACKSVFRFSLLKFGWLYQIVAMVCLISVAAVTFSKIGSRRIGGKDARPEHSFEIMVCNVTDLEGISVGIVNWGINEPRLFWKCLSANWMRSEYSPEHWRRQDLLLGRCFYNWTFVPYSF